MEQKKEKYFKLKQENEDLVEKVSKVRNSFNIIKPINSAHFNKYARRIWDSINFYSLNSSKMCLESASSELNKVRFQRYDMSIR